MDAASVASTVHLGELGLDGRLRPVPGVLPAVVAAAQAGIRRVVVPWANREEAELVDGMTVLGAVNLAEVARWHGARRRGRRPGARRAVAAVADDRAAIRPRRGDRAARGRRCARRRGGGRSPPAHDRTARRGQDDARPAPARDPSRPRRPGRARDGIHPLARRRAGHAPLAHAAVRGAASLGEHGGARRRRARGRCDPARSRGRATECCSSTRRASSRRVCSTRCGSRSRAGRS